MSLIKGRGAAPATQKPDGSFQGDPKLAELRAKVKLDRHALDLAAEEQPQLYLDAADQRVLARSRADEAKDNLTRTDARLGREVRAQMEKEGAKPTEGRVADVVLGHQDHLDAAAKFAEARREADEWDALTSALEHRKSMIRELATLYASGYYTAGAAAGARGQVRDTQYAAGKEALAARRADR